MESNDRKRVCNPTVARRSPQHSHLYVVHSPASEHMWIQPLDSVSQDDIGGEMERGRALRAGRGRRSQVHHRLAHGAGFNAGLVVVVVLAGRDVSKQSFKSTFSKIMTTLHTK